MKLIGIPFQTIDWSSIAPTEHRGWAPLEDKPWLPFERADDE